MKKQILCAALSLSVALLCTTAARGAEPTMASYNSLPIFQSSSVMPNILVMLDNSGSMNFPAYPDPYNADVDGISNGTVLANASYTGIRCQVSVHVTNGSDDAEERLSDKKIWYCGQNMLISPDLDLITDELQITAGIMPQLQIARSQSGSAADAAGLIVPVLRVPSVAGTQVAAATAGQTMSDAGMLPAAGRPAFRQDLQAGLELAPQRYVSAQDEPGIMVLAARSSTTTSRRSTTTTTIRTTTTTTIRTTTTTSIAYCSDQAGQVVGIRFRNIQIPKSVNGVPVVITSARIIFTASAASGDETTDPATLYIAGQAADNPGEFNAGTSSSPTIANISGRAETTAKVTWANIGPWTADSQANATTPDLKDIVQEIINRTNWQAGNAMVFKITGDAGSRRRAHSYNSSASKSPVLVIEYEPCVPKKYYGYFNPDARYSYSSNVFRRNAAGAWSGNFLNWLTMRRVDVLRKALMGGKKPCETCNGEANLQGEVPAQTSRYWQTYYYAGGDDDPKPTPYTEAWYGVKDGKLYVKETTAGYTSDGNDPWDSPTASFVVEVKVMQADEPDYFCTEGEEAGNPCGIIQKVGAQARWGNIWFHSSGDGGKVASAIGGKVRDIINNFQSTPMDQATPLAETLYTAMKYFAQSCTLPSGYGQNCSPWAIKATTDPFYDGKNLIPCAKSFVLMLTDGVSTSDKNIPTAIKNFDGDTNETTRTYDSDGSDYLDDVALYSHVKDLRSDLEGTQAMDTFVIYAFGKDPDAQKLLIEAAMSGGFDDRNENEKPDGYDNDGNFTKYAAAQRREWDRNGDGLPDNFYEADDGYLLEKQLLAAINAILNKAASGTAVSVLATTGEGEGTLVQAIFRPGITADLSEVNWVGYLQSLWVDPKGNIREDTNKNKQLDLDADRVVTYYFDTATSETRVKRYDVSEDAPYPDKDTVKTDNITLEELGASAIWEAGTLLSDRPADERKIYTYVGAMPSIASPTAFGSGDCVAFTAANAASIKPFLGVQDNFGTTPVYTVQPYAYLGATEDKRAENLIEYIRGKDSKTDQYPDLPGIPHTATVRNRIIDGKVWKLGDIVYSTPVTITRPVEKYGLIYDDTSYQAYVDKYGDNATTARESVVYVGGNDGMLHAFTGGVFNKSLHGFAPRSGTSERVGDELWAYIPRAALPHLKWLASVNYDSLAHVPYVDLKPKVIDVRIFEDDDVHPGGWGTVLVGGMNFGGKYIWVNDTLGNKVANYYSSYFAIDITDPRNPQLLWDKWFPGLGLTINMPTVMSVGRTFNGPTKTWNNDDSWYLVLGSGYDDFNGWVLDGRKGSLYIVDIKTGELKKQFQTAESCCYMNTPIAIDKSLNYSVDSIYAAANYWNGVGWFINASNVYRIGIPITNSPYIEGFEARYNKDPASWTWTKMVAGTGLPIVSAPFTISSDKKDNVWLYLGSGRYQLSPDKTDSSQNWLMGVKDPFYNAMGTVAGGAVPAPECYHSYTATDCAVTVTDLFYSNPYIIKPNNVVQTLSGGVSGITTWDKLIAEVRKINAATKLEFYQGWYRTLVDPGTAASERMVNKPTVYGGIAVFPAYTPNVDSCGFGGNSRLYALYYETGTAYKKPVLIGLDNTEVIKYSLDLGYGLSSSFGIHAAREKGAGATLYSQMSTGLINEIDILPAFSTKSGVENWKEGR